MPIDDATLRSLKLFDDPTHWDKIEENVPIFVPHVAYDKEGKALYTIDDAKLHEVAKEINRMYDEDGCPFKIFDGHTMPAGQVAQKDQPALLGYGVGAFVGPWGKMKRLAVLAKKLFYAQGTKATVEQRPERSPEFYPNTLRIKALALLKTDPKLEMGMTIYQDSDGPCVQYSRGMNYWDSMDPTQMPPSNQQQGTPPGAGEGAMGNEPMLDESEKQKFMQYMKALYPKLHEQYAAGMGMGPAAGSPPAGLAFPSASNTQLPRVTMSQNPITPAVATVSTSLPPAAPVAQAPVAPAQTPSTFAQDAAAIQYQQLQAQVNELKLVNTRHACEAQVLKLMGEGYQFLDGKAADGKQIPGFELEVQRLMQMDEPARLMRADEVRHCYHRDPSKQPMLPVNYAQDGTAGGSQGNGIDQLVPAEINKVVKYCEQQKLNYANEEDRAKAVAYVLKNRQRDGIPAHDPAAGPPLTAQPSRNGALR